MHWDQPAFRDIGNDKKQDGNELKMDISSFRMMTIDSETAEELCDSHQEKWEKKILVSRFSIECLKGK